MRTGDPIPVYVPIDTLWQGGCGDWPWRIFAKRAPLAGEPIPGMFDLGGKLWPPLIADERYRAWRATQQQPEARDHG